MTDTTIFYIIFGIIALLAVFAIVIGMDKMIKLILGNYILMILCLAANQSLVVLIQFLQKFPDLKFAGLNYGDLAGFFVSSKTILVVLLYVGFFLLIYKKSKITISLPQDEIIEKTLHFFLIPLTVISMILTLQIAVMGVNVISYNELFAFASSLTDNVAIIHFISLTPVWLLIHAVATLIITSEVKMSIKTDI